MNLIENLRDEISSSLKQLGINVLPEDIVESKFSDLETRIAFSLAREDKRSPKEIADEIVSKLTKNKPKYIARVESKNGYINFYFDYKKIAEEFIGNILRKREIQRQNKRKEKVVIDFSCPNPGKPMHIGHIRSTIIGDCLVRVNRFLGYDVVASNYMNDRGLHIGKLMAAINMWGIPSLDKIKEPEKFLMDLYVRFNKEAEKNPELNKKAHEWIRKIDLKDKKALELLDKIYEISWKGFKEIYDRLGVNFDEVIRETEIVDFGKQIVKEALDKGIAFKAEEGQIVANLEDYGLPNTVILRSDGTPLYITSDLGLAKYRYSKHKFDRMIYVTANEQNLHFKQVFKILEILGYEWAKKCEHVGFGLVMLPEGKISTREGRVIFLKDVLDKVSDLAKREVEKRGYALENIDYVAEKIAIAALKFAILSVDNNKEIYFSWEKILNFDGKTGPYLLYSYVRANSILEKTNIPKTFSVGEVDENEKKLLRQMIKFYSVLENVSKTNQPSRLANYLFELAKTFTEFYHKNKVIGSKRQDFRVALVFAFKTVMQTGLELLGIETVEKM